MPCCCWQSPKQLPPHSEKVFNSSLRSKGFVSFGFCLPFWPHPSPFFLLMPCVPWFFSCFCMVRAFWAEYFTCSKHVWIASLKMETSGEIEGHLPMRHLFTLQPSSLLSIEDLLIFRAKVLFSVFPLQNTEELMISSCGAGKDSWESLRL